MTTKVLPVIHFLTVQQALDNARIARDAGCPGVFLISMDGRDDDLDQAIMAVKHRFTDLYVGANFLTQSPLAALKRSLDLEIHATWSDRPGVTSFGPNHEALEIAKLLDANPGHDFFGSIAFKYQAPERFPDQAAVAAANQGMIATTSGDATGVAADPEKLKGMRAALDKHYAKAGFRPSLALASGITPENAHLYLDSTTHFLVSTGICNPGDFYNFSAERLAALMAVVTQAARN